MTTVQFIGKKIDHVFLFLFLVVIYLRRRILFLVFNFFKIKINNFFARKYIINNINYFYLFIFCCLEKFTSFVSTLLSILFLQVLKTVMYYCTRKTIMSKAGLIIAPYLFSIINGFPRILFNIQCKIKKKLINIFIYLKRILRILGLKNQQNYRVIYELND